VNESDWLAGAQQLRSVKQNAQASEVENEAKATMRSRARTRPTTKHKI